MKFKTTVYFGLLFTIQLILQGCESTTGNLTDPIPDYPILSISSDEFDFDLKGSQRDLTLSNTGSDSLGWTFTDYPSWIIPSQESGVLLTSSSIIVEITVDRTILDAGEYSGQITIESNGGNLSVSVSVEQSEEPVLGELPGSLDFGLHSEEIDFEISNTGRDTIFWSASISSGHLTIEPNSGEITEAMSVQLTFDRENAPAILLYSTLTITTQNESVEIPIIADNSSAASGWLSQCESTETYSVAEPQNWFYLTRFDRPADWDSFVIDSVRIKLFSQFNAFDDIQVCCFSVYTDGLGDLWPNYDNLIYLTQPLNPVSGWSTWAVNWPLDLSTFCVGYYQVNIVPIVFPMPYFDGSSLGGYSYLIWETPFGELAVDFMHTLEWCIEVYVTPYGTTNGEKGGSWLNARTLTSNQLMNGQQPEPHRLTERVNGNR